VSNYDISSTVATVVSQRLVRKLCDKCKKEKPLSEEEKKVIEGIGKRYNEEFDLKNAHTYTAMGCKECNNIGYYDRVGVFEILSMTDELKDLIVNRRI
jgi:type IV pilus assembly protein PilB